jgi:hypothetical protein
VIESRSYPSPLDELETLIRSAGDYVRASDDLRPRVLENARSQCCEQRVRRRFWQIAVAALFCVILMGSLAHRSESAIGAKAHTSAWTSPMFAPVEAAARSNDPSWQMVESFTQLRLRQAQLLRL